MIRKENASVVESLISPRSAVQADRSASESRLALAIRDHLTIAQIAARKGKVDELIAAMRSAYAIDLPQTPRHVEAAGIAAVWAGPEQWLIIAADANARDLERELRPRLAGLASVSDQSDSRTVMRLTGETAVDVLMTGVPIDLHASVFKPDDAAITHAAHIGVMMWRHANGQGYDIACTRSFAASLRDWLLRADARCRSAVSNP
jgi:sarcosine oxidase subunit gamma